MCVSIYIYKPKHTHTHTHTLKYYSDIKKNEILSFAETWMDLEIIILNELRKRQIGSSSCGSAG